MKGMKVIYKVGFATLLQFILITLLSVPNTIVSVVTKCHTHQADCASNTMSSLLFFLLIAFWFSILAVLGYLVQVKRSRKLAVLLIGAESMTAIVALFNSRHEAHELSVITSLLDCLLALWVSLLGARIVLAKGRRMRRMPLVKKVQQVRKRPVD